MSRTPEVVIVKWRKFLHDLFGGIASLAGIVALVALLLGGNFVPAMLVAIVSAIIAANIKYKLVKQVEVGGYKLQ